MRFQDDGETLHDFTRPRIVKCPKCSHAITIKTDQVSCTNCGYNKPYVDTPRLHDFIQIKCCGEILWANNFEHLDFIEKYVAAKLRERKPNVNRSVASRLPSWIKDKSNRDKILKAISKFKKEFGTEI